MKFAILVSTMDQKDYTLLERMNINDDVIVINQGRVILENLEVGVIKWINVNERGLSKSRNLAIENSNHNIVLLADDDLVYEDNVGDIIKQAFIQNPEYDILTFQVYGKDSIFKVYSGKKSRVGYIKSLKKASVEIALNLDRIREKNIKFNEVFGSGSTYKMGEDNIFLFDCLKKGLSIGYIPIKIAELEVGKSTWFNGFTKTYFNDLGAVYTEMSYVFSYFLILQFALRKHDLYKDNMNGLEAIKEMLNGRKYYLKNR